MENVGSLFNRLGGCLDSLVALIKYLGACIRTLSLRGGNESDRSASIELYADLLSIHRAHLWI